MSALCQCEGYRRPWWARVHVWVGWFLFDLVTRSLAALLAFVALGLLACAAWLIGHGVRVLPFALVTLLACAGCTTDGKGLPSSSCATCAGEGVNDVDAKTLVFSACLVACGGGGAAGPDAGVGGEVLGPPSRVPAGHDAGVSGDLAVSPILDSSSPSDLRPQRVDALVTSPDLAPLALDALAALDAGYPICADPWPSGWTGDMCARPAGAVTLCSRNVPPGYYTGTPPLPCWASSRVRDAGAIRLVFAVLDCSQCAVQP